MFPSHMCYMHLKILITYHIQQTQANIINIPVDRPAMRETTALGAAIAAGFAVGVWKEFNELKEINQKDRMIFEPNVEKEVGDKMFKKWEKVSDLLV